MAKDYQIGSGKLAGKAVYANRDFSAGEVVIKYNWRELTTGQWRQLPASEKRFTHSFWGRIQLFGEPERYVNHSDQPNTEQDLEALADRAIKPIKAGQEITTDARLELKNELESLIKLTAARAGDSVSDINWVRISRNSASCRYGLINANSQMMTADLNRAGGRWQITNQIKSDSTGAVG